MIRPINEYLRMLISENGYETATIFAAGQYIHLMEKLPLDVVQIVDYDKFLYLPDYEVKDCIFDDIEVKGEVIITLHGEKLYPPHLVYPDHDHIIIVDKQFHNENCTTVEDYKDMDMEDFGRWAVVEYLR